MSAENVACKALDEEGLFDMQDLLIGEHILEMERRRFHFSSEYGLEFCRHIISFMRGGQRAGRRALLVHLLAKGSLVDYFPRSHLLELAAIKGGRLLWETPKEALTEAGCSPCEKNFPDGGLVILDARMKYEIKTGYAITFEFGTEELVRKWPKMELPKLEVLKQKVASI
ncbi:hypothetical protein ISF_09886 [Cordyceps fumosorosea ARSEF 2679]|uniref:Uncharacterized protein n=1 Tax=Cordyceps fumosorosea (strain ARSEF 2679) TaxID=1081104 RepID=A0A162J2E7_CORFA|nr:hypothetical protein ISF_09886 [Cordyceps fumosorosea ARSEF 2679]OAA38528.1 hypothetical protein ISF_09886 [Cordyceps fumosorosea ARSEF 2679]